MSTPTLYWSPGACSLAVHIALEEAGFPYESVRVPLADGANLKPEYLAVNPRSRVPALKIENNVLTEVPAILLWLATRHPQAGVLPGGPEGLARAMEWMSWLTSAVHAGAFGAVFRPARFVADAALYDAVAAKARERVQEAFADIEQRIGDGPWLLGNRYCAVDGYLLVFHRWGDRIGMDVRGLYPGWAAHAQRVVARPAVQHTLNQEEIVVWSC